MPYRHILIAVDFTPTSEHATDVGANLAAALGAEVTLLHAWQLPAYTFPDGAVIPTADDASRVSDWAQASIERVAASLTGRVSKVTALVRNGNPAEVVVATAREVAADLIVVGTHGRGALGRTLLGSVAEKVVRAAEQPVLTVRATH